MTKALAFLPVLVFAALVLLLWRGFDLDEPHQLPSPLLNKQFPDFQLPSLEDGAPLTAKNMIGEVALVNLWATWCSTCYAEHQALMDISRRFEIPIYGINYKDSPQAAAAWLKRLGNPFRFNVVDEDGKLGIELGAYGAPETFVIDARGVIRHKRVGDVNERVWTQELWPVIQRLRAENNTAAMN